MDKELGRDSKPIMACKINTEKEQKLYKYYGMLKKIKF